MVDSVTIQKSDERAPEEKTYLVRWKNRQRMAWLSFWFMIIFTILLWFVVPVWYKHMDINEQQWTDQITNSAEWLYITLGSVILGYMGTTAMMIRGNKVTYNEEDF